MIRYLNFIIIAPIFLVSNAPNAYATETSLADRQDILFTEDYESGQLWVNNWSVPGERSSVTSMENHASGSISLKVNVQFPNPNGYGVNSVYEFQKEGQTSQEIMHFRYYLYYDPSFNCDNAGYPGDQSMGKLPGPWSDPLKLNVGAGGNQGDGADGFSARMMHKCVDGDTKTLLGFYAYPKDQIRLNWMWSAVHHPGDGGIGDVGSINRGEWVSVEGMIKMNSIDGNSGRADGILRGWVNGEPAFERTDIVWRDITSLKVDRFWKNVYVGGLGSQVTAPMHLFIDDVVVANTYVGQHNPGGVAPVQVTGLSARKIGLNGIEVSWSPVQHIDGIAAYTVWRKEASGPWRRYESVLGTTTTYKDLYLEDGNYQYKVTAFSKRGN